MKLALKESKEKVYVLGNLQAIVTIDGKEERGELTAQTTNLTVKTKELLLALVNVKSDGLTMSEIHKKVKLIDLIETSEGEIELTDSQVEDLKIVAKDFKWAVACKSISDLGKDLGITDDVE